MAAARRPLYLSRRRREVYRRFFNCNVAFSAEFDAIICPAIDMERPMHRWRNMQRAV
ncbi:AraC family transcriptional regulator ligand-binding domain-containing protein [Bradyrhizobium japonicum]|nr:AraC family transcriptional regulator ligand-binding domain-containing protein [Bradyrhizobium japonicum]